MSETFDECPLKVEPPEFKNDYYEPASNFVIEFGVGKDKGKVTESYIDVNGDLGSTYDMELAVKINGKWTWVTCQAMRLVIKGSYERGGFLTALQQTGLLTLPFYGKMKTAEEHEEEWNRKHAIREQT